MNRSPIVVALRWFVQACVAALAACGGGSGGDAGTASTFSKSYGGPLHDEARVVLNTDDGGYMLFGSADGDELGTASSLQAGLGSPQGGDFWLQKLDANGNVEHSRTIGSRPAAAVWTTWRRARPTADGGVVLAGTDAVKQRVARPSGATEFVTADRNFAVTKLDASGNVVWSVTHDSGVWRNYGYFEHNGQAAAAQDFVDDVWPLADGGFLVAGTSIANLEDRLNIGFPCDDAELNPLMTDHRGFETCPGGGPDGGSRFTEAYSVVVMRLNADGSLRWVRRLVDNPYDSRNNRRPDGLGVVVRASADGGVVLSRPVGGSSALVHRLLADGSPLWRTLLRNVLSGFNTSIAPIDLIQTDDAVDGPGADRYDGVRDDGFLLATPDKLVKLGADGSLQWNAGLAALEGVVRSDPDPVIHNLTQHCDFGRPTRCDFVVVGSVKTQTQPLIDPNVGRLSGFVAFVDQDGSLRTQVYAPRDPSGAPVFTSFTRIAGAGTARFRLLALDGGTLGLIDLQAPPAAPAYLNERTAAQPSAGRGTHELRPDGSVLMLETSGQVLHFFDTQARVLSELNVGNVTASEVLRAAVQIGPGRYVLAGTRRAADGSAGLVALRYDLDASGGRIVWQRRIVDDEGGDLLAASASGDGGVVLSLLSTESGEPGRIGRVLKLDADGNRQWENYLPGPAAELEPMPDGGFVALSFAPEDGSAAQVTRITPAGLRQWNRSVSLGEGQGAVRALTPTADGGTMLVGSFGPRISLVRLAPDGALVSARDVELPVDRGREVYFEQHQIRQAADGGFLLAMTEHELLTRLGADAMLRPYGQSNILVLKVDAAGQPLWSHVYGARFSEGLRDLALRADGTIALAGYSDSLGERREAWLLKLSPQGLISDGGCQALLGSIAPALMSTSSRSVTVTDSQVSVTDIDLPPFDDTRLPLHEQADFVTARQCLGDAGAGGAASPAPARQRLSVLQVGSQRGAVTSTPVGISCATGLDICSADFAAGSRVSLRADRSNFVAWRGDCDEGSGGTALECVIVLSRDRSVQVEFGPPAPPPPRPVFALSFAVQGPGFVRADGGINCGEGGSAAACSRDFSEGTLVNASADASPGQVFLGWSGDTSDSVCRSFGRQTAVRITVDRNLRCFAQFGPAGERLVAIAVTGAGLVRQEPAAGAINCREGGGPDDCQEIYTATETLLLRALPDAGQRFAGWGGDCAPSGIDPNITLLTAQGFSCSASFVPLVTGATLTVQIVNGTVGRAVDSQPAGINCSAGSGSDCSQTYAPGTSVLLRATPAGFRSWQGCDAVVDVSLCSVTMNQSRSVTASFDP